MSYVFAVRSATQIVEAASALRGRDDFQFAVVRCEFDRRLVDDAGFEAIEFPAVSSLSVSRTGFDGDRVCWVTRSLLRA